MRIFVMTVIIFLNLILQSTALHSIEINHIVPNTSLVLIVSYGILRGDIEGGIFGFFSGLLMDIFFGRVIGLYALLGFFAGFLAGKPFKDFYRRNFLTPVIFICVVSFLYEIVFYFISFLFRGKVDLGFYITTIILPEAVYNMLATVIIYPILYGINRLLEVYEKPKRKMFDNIGGLNGKI